MIFEKNQDVKTWVEKTADLLRHNLSFAYAAMSKEPPSQWCLALLNTTGPVEAFVDKHLPIVPIASPFSAGGAPEREQEKKKEEAEEQKEIEEKPDAASINYFYGWNFDLGLAWRAEMLANGKAGKKEWHWKLGHLMPFSPEESINAHFVNGDQALIDEMPMRVYVTKYPDSATKWVDFEGSGFSLSDFVPNKSKAAPGGSEAASPTPPGGSEAASPTPPASAAFCVNEKLIHTDGTTVVNLITKKQAGRIDLFQLKFGGKAVLHSHQTADLLQIMREIMGKLAEGKVGLP